MKRIVTASLLIVSISALGSWPRAEGAQVIATSYVGPSYGDWNTSTNWSPAGVPANNSSNNYSVTVSSGAVTFDLAGSTTINNLLLSNTLNLNSGCSLSVTGQLALAGASLSGNGGNFSASGTASLLSSNLSAGSGAQLSFPTLTQISEADWPNSNSLQANNAGSLLDLSQVTTISASTAVYIDAGTGGKVSLPSVAQINNTGFGSCTLNASGGTIDVSGISATGNNGGITTVQLSNSGTVLWGNPTTLNNLSLSISGSGNTIAIGQVASAANFNANATNGGLIVFPSLTAINEADWPNSNSLQASNTGSLLDLSHVTTISSSTSLSIQTGTGGKISLPNVTQINSAGSFGSCTLNASGGTIDVSGISATGNNGGITTVQLSNSGTVLWGNPTTLNNLSLSISGSGNTIAIGQVASAANFNANATNGGLIVFPSLTAISEADWPNSNSLQASNTGSLLDLSHVTTISSSTSLSIQTGTGGKISLPNVTHITNTGFGSCTLNASGGTIDVSGVGSGISSIQVGGGGVVLLSGSASVSGGITLSGGSSAATQGMLEMSGAIATMTFTDMTATDTDLTIGGTSPGDLSVLDFRVGSAADRLLLEAGELLVNSGGGLIEITPEPGLAPGTYDLIDFNAGKASGLSSLSLATTAAAGYTFCLGSTPTSEQLVVAAAVPEPSTIALLVASAMGLAAYVRRRRPCVP